MQDFMLEQQTFISNGMTNFNYLTQLVLTPNPKKEMDQFLAFDSLKIFPVGNQLKFEGDMTTAYNSLSEKNLREIKTTNAKNLIFREVFPKEHNISFNNNFEKNLLFDLIQLELEEDEEKENYIINETKLNKKGKKLFELIKMTFGIKPTIYYYEDEEDYIFSLEMKEANLDFITLRKLKITGKLCKEFYIAGKYEENNDDCLGVVFSWELK